MQRTIHPLTDGAEHTVHAYYDIPPWSPRNGRIVFTRMAEPDSSEGTVCTMAPDGSGVCELGTAHGVGPNTGARPQWDCEGRRVYFKDIDKQGSLVRWVDTESGEEGFWRGNLYMINPSAHEMSFPDPMRSYPDEMLVRDRERFGIYKQELREGAEPICLATMADCFALHPRREEIRDWHVVFQHTKWSPDGNRLLVVVTNEAPYTEKYQEKPRVKDIFVVERDGSNLRHACEFSDHPVWHPDSRRILANLKPSEREPVKLMFCDSESGEQAPATEAVEGGGHPSVSPDGRRLLQDCLQGSKHEGLIRMVDLETEQVTALAAPRLTDHTHQGTHMHPVWSRDSRWVLYAADPRGKGQLYLVESE